MWEKMETYNKSKNLQELVRVVRENPDLEVIAKVDTELLDDEFGWMRGCFGPVEIDEYCERNERVHLRSEDEQLVIDHVVDDIVMSEGYKEGDVSDEELEARVKKQIDWKRAIFVIIQP